MVPGRPQCPDFRRGGVAHKGLSSCTVDRHRLCSRPLEGTVEILTVVSGRRSRKLEWFLSLGT